MRFHAIALATLTAFTAACSKGGDTTKADSTSASSVAST
jgi:hypothetical protein